MLLRRRPVVVLIAHSNTPLALELTIRSALRFNPELDLQFLVADEFPLPGTLGGLPVRWVGCPDAEHGDRLSHLVGGLDCDCEFVMLDSDVEFNGFGVLSRLLGALGPSRVFASSVQVDGDRAWLQDNPGCVLSVGPHRFNRRNVPQARICPWVSAWKYDVDLRAVLADVSFGPALQTRLGAGRFWDTCGLVFLLMRHRGRVAVEVPGSGYLHHGGVSHEPGKYEELIPVFRKALES